MAGDAEDAETRRSRLELFAVLAVGVLIKFAYLGDYVALPFIDVPLFDAEVYAHQTRAILAGRFGDATLIAFSPLTGWFGAALGGNPFVIAFVQCGMGVLDGYLLYRIASRYASPRLALIAPLVLFGYGMALSYESKVVSEPLGLFFAVLATERMTSPAFREGARGAALVTGILFASTVLARASLLFALPFVVLASALPYTGTAARPSLRREGMRAALVTSGIALILVGNGLWNLANTGLFVPVISVSQTIEHTTSTTFDGALRPDHATTLASPWDVVRQAEARIAARARGESDRPMPGVNLVGFVLGAPKKIWRTLSDTEITFDYPYYGERTVVPTLERLPITFGGILSLGLLGIVGCVRSSRARSLWPLMPLVAGVLVVTSLYHPSSRYRLAMIVPMIALAPAGIEWMLGLARAERLAGFAFVGAILGVLAYQTYTYELRQPGAFEGIVAEAYAKAGDYENARIHAERALALEPDSPDVRARVDLVRRFRPQAAPSE